MEKEYGGSTGNSPFLTVRFFSAEGRRLDFLKVPQRNHAKPRPAHGFRGRFGGRGPEGRDFACNAMALRLEGAGLSAWEPVRGRRI